VIEIARFHSPAEAQIARGALEAAGIHAVLFDANLSAAYGGAVRFAPARLMVEEQDEAAARAFLAAAGD